MSRVTITLVLACLAARGATPSAFERRCIPPGRVAPPSNTPGIATPPRKPRAAGAPVLSRRALPAGRLARLGATPDFHHGLLRVSKGTEERTKVRGMFRAPRPLVCFASSVSLVTFVSFVRPSEARGQTTEVVGVRAQGMGGAFTAVADDATATWWNPAGLARGAYFNAIV